MLPPNGAEWLEADGLGGFASGPVVGPRTRRYHALLLPAIQPPAGRVALVNGIEVSVTTPAGVFALSSQRYTPDGVHPDGARRVSSFTGEPWPTWTYGLEDGTRIVHELFARHGSPAVALSWRLEWPDAPPVPPSAPPPAPATAKTPVPVTLEVRPLLSGRDFHGLMRENAAFRMEGEVTRQARSTRVRWRPYEDLPPVIALANGEHESAPTWYRQFQYDDERARGLDFVEDLAAPGVFRFDLAKGPAVLILAAGDDVLPRSRGAASMRDAWVREERERRAFPSRLARSADAYFVARGSGRTLIAGYPWFGDWGRDTFIALRGLGLSLGRLDDVRSILLEWAGAVSEGMLPNRFPDGGQAPEYNSVDASLWYVIAVHESLSQAGGAEAASRLVPAAERAALEAAVDAILDGYARGTRYGIHMEGDGLLAAGAPGVQLTWMDARVGERVITPRWGKPVEIQALWLNALRLAGARDPRWLRAYERGRASFERRFWNDERGILNDVVDVEGRLGAVDATFRPNQIFAVGGVPYPLLAGERARRVVEAVEARLGTSRGLRSLAPGEPGYMPHYEGGVAERDGSYHQGTAWLWLAGPFVEAWLRTRTPEERAGGRAAVEARERFLAPLTAHLDEAGLGHLSEIADAEPPFTPRGCPFQAWSLGELIRTERLVSRAAQETGTPAITAGAPASASVVAIP